MANFRSGFLRRGYPLGKLVRAETAYASDLVPGSQNIYVDGSGVQQIDITGVGQEFGSAATRSGAGPYDIEVTLQYGQGGQYQVGDIINISNATGWTDNGAFLKSHTITATTDATVTFQTTEDPGPSGFLDMALDPSERNMLLLDGNIVGQTLLLRATNVGSFQFDDNQGQQRLQSVWQPQEENDTLTVVWTGIEWVETGRTEQAFETYKVYRSSLGGLSQSDILGLNTAPVQVIDPPSSASALIVIDSVQLAHKYSTAAYATNTTLQLKYVGGSVIMAENAILASTTAGTTKYVATPNLFDVSPSGGPAVAVTTDLGTGVELTVATGDPTAGDPKNTLDYIIIYHEQQVDV